MIKFIDSKSIITIYLIDTNYKVWTQLKKQEKEKITKCCKL